MLTTLQDIILLSVYHRLYLKNIYLCIYQEISDKLLRNKLDYRFLLKHPSGKQDIRHSLCDTLSQCSTRPVTFLLQLSKLHFSIHDLEGENLNSTCLWSWSRICPYVLPGKSPSRAWIRAVLPALQPFIWFTGSSNAHSTVGSWLLSVQRLII